MRSWYLIFKTGNVRFFPLELEPELKHHDCFGSFWLRIYSTVVPVVKSWFFLTAFRGCELKPLKKKFFDILSLPEGNLLGKTIVLIFSGMCISS
jgi:hypothetical protein